MKIAVVLGTRPEIIKLAPIMSKLNKKSFSLIFTGQHYDYDMSIRFINQLGICKPNKKRRKDSAQALPFVLDALS